MLRRRSLERRLFGWLLVFALVPALVLVAAGAWLVTGSVDRIGTLGPWAQVAESGRELFDAAAEAAGADPVLAEAVERHRGELSGSLVLARRWAYLGERVATGIPLLALGLAGVIGLLALTGSRRLARGLARPIHDLVGWTERVAREEPLPPPDPGEAREVVEVRALRDAFRRAETELSAARRRALEAERTRVWGEMARRVAHEMKNPLTPLRLAARRLVAAAAEAPDLGEPVVVIAEETERLEELARQFTALGRPPEGPRSAVDLGELCGTLLTTDVPPRIETAVTVTAGLPLVDAHYDALLRAFRNLLRNAMDAIESAGGAGRIEIDIRAGGGADGGWIEVVVADTGPGLPAGAGDRIFEPDFTTRSRGTGLGLALVRQAVMAHGGAVTARDRPVGGAEFVVRLPVAGARPMARV